MSKTSWPVKTLGDVCEVIAGQSPEGKFYNKEGKGVPFYQGKKDFAERVLGSPTTWTSEVTKLARPGDILMSVRAPVGPVNLCPIEACIGRGLAAIRPSSKTDTDFIYYYLESIQSEIAGTEGAVFASINKAQIAGLSCPVPPLEEQKRIVALLDAATARVTELTACYEQARTHANNLFTSALRDALAPLESWPVKRLGDLCLFVRGPFGGSLKKSVFVATGHAVYEQQHAIYERFNQFRYFVSEDKFQEMKRFEVSPGDILMSCSGTIGKTAIVPSGAPAGIINQALLKLSCLEQLDNQYLCVWMRSSYFQEAVIGSAGGAALQNVASVAILKDIPISLPPLDEQKKIVDRLDSLRAKTSEMVAAYVAKLTAAKNLRQSILEAAFAGEL